MVIPVANTKPSKTPRNFLTTIARWPWWLQWLIFTIVALALYAPILGNSFVSDDWIVLRRLVTDRQLNTNGFFRPLSDITIWLNYQLGGLNSLNYYLTGILIRGLGTLFLYRFCLRLPWDETDNRKYVFALIAALLFVTYPFHNESVAWILGRGALMAGTLGMAALVILTGKGSQSLKIAGVCICYFVGLAAYETIVVLPLLVLAYMLWHKMPVRLIATWQLFLWLTLALHILLRVSVSGSLTGDYGSGFFKINILTFFLNAAKASVRTVFPPASNPNIYFVLGFFLLMQVLIISTRMRELFWEKFAPAKVYAIAWSSWLMAMLIPFLTSVSTRTSENERFLEFPSYFYCMLLAFVVIYLHRKLAFWTSLGLLFTYNIYSLEKNNSNWVKASDAVQEILQAAKNNSSGTRLFVFDLPGDIKGAYTFRVGFTEALLLNGIDTSRVKQVTKLPEDLQPADKVYQWKNGKWNKLQ